MRLAQARYSKPTNLDDVDDLPLDTVDKVVEHMIDAADALGNKSAFIPMDILGLTRINRFAEALENHGYAVDVLREGLAVAWGEGTITKPMSKEEVLEHLKKQFKANRPNPEYVDDSKVKDETDSQASANSILGGQTTC